MIAQRYYDALVKVEDTLRFAERAMFSIDLMNAAKNCQSTVISPLTTELREAMSATWDLRTYITMQEYQNQQEVAKSVDG